MNKVRNLKPLIATKTDLMGVVRVVWYVTYNDRLLCVYTGRWDTEKSEDCSSFLCSNSLLKKSWRRLSYFWSRCIRC